MTPYLTVVTACFRPENLCRVGASVRYELGRARINYQWWVVPEPKAAVQATVCGPDRVLKPCSGDWGHPHKNAAIDVLQREDPEGESFVYFLDDDNLIHPGFVDAFRIGAQVSSGVGCVFSQAWWGGELRLQADEAYGVNTIDTAMMCLSLNAIGKDRFCHQYDADGHFFESVIKRVTIARVPGVGCYYNAIRDM